MGKQTTPPSALIDLILADNQPNNYLRGGHSNYPLGGHGDNDRLFGVAGNDKVYSGDGNDYLAVQTGTDLLNGGTEADRFEFVTLSDSGTSGGIDTLVELNPSQGDLIEIRYLTFEDDGEYSRPISPVDQATDENDELKLTFDGEKAILSFVFGEEEVGGVDAITEAIIWLLGDHSKAQGLNGIICRAPSLDVANAAALRDTEDVAMLNALNLVSPEIKLMSKSEIFAWPLPNL